MKNLIVLFFLMVLLIPALVCAGGCADSVVVTPWANCESWGYNATWKSTCEVRSTSGLGPHSWVPANETTYAQGAVTIYFKYGGEMYSKMGPKIYKSDWCSPSGEPLPGPSGSSAPKPISLPKRQPYLLFVDEQMYCYTIMKTPILGDAEEAWCQLGTVPEGINDFCLQPNYKELFGCTLENYNVHYPSREQLIRYYCG